MPRTSRAEEVSTPEIRKKSVFNIGGKTEAKIIPEEGKPDLNEDAAINLKERGIAGVFDGVGGGLGGKEVSGAAAKIITKELKSVPDNADAKKWESEIRAALKKAQTEIIRLGNELFFDQLGDPLVAAMYRDKPQKEIESLMEKKDISPGGTTASVVKMIERPDGGADLVYGHAGDSRIYVLKKDGTLKQITKDQGLLEEAVEENYYTKEEADFIDQATSKEEILEKFGEEKGNRVLFEYKHLRRGVRSALGFSELRIQTGVGHLEPGDRAIITSDGIHDNLTHEEIRQEILRGGTPEEISARLVEAAKKRSGETTLRSKIDDKTAMVLEVPELTEVTEAAEEPTITPEQAAKMEADLQKLQEMSEYLGKLLPMAKTMERGLTPLTSKKRLGEIMSLGGARGVEDTLYTTQTAILEMERNLVEHQGNISAMQKLTNQIRELREKREEHLKARDQETIDRIKSKVA